MFSYVAVLYIVVAILFTSLKFYLELDDYIFSGHVFVTLILSLIFLEPILTLATLISRISLLNQKLIETFYFRQTRKTFRVKLVYNRKVQEMIIQNTSSIYLQVHDIIVLLNSVFGFLVSSPQIKYRIDNYY